MTLIRKALALVAWIVIWVPTTVFVTLVMLKAIWQNARARARSRREALGRDRLGPGPVQATGEGQ